MNAVPFDTLTLARDLAATALTPPVAAGSASVLADALIGADLATRSDLALLETKLRGALGVLDLKIERLRRATTIKLGGMIFVAVGGLLAAMRLMPQP
ncbi:MAG TPA: hypothetical protein VK726_20215 [Acetobacteraceae bacterium]|jgi:hypothetical protein|nr:hypothetical protein [Acetobacteraceae bacterium]